MLVLHGNALRYGLICRQYGKTSYPQNNPVPVETFNEYKAVCLLGQAPQIKAEQNSYHQNVWKNK